MNKNYKVSVAFEIKAGSRKEASLKVRSTLKELANLTSAENWLGNPYMGSHTLIKAMMKGVN